MKKYFVIYLLFVIFCIRSNSQSVLLIKDNLSGKDDGIPTLNPVDELMIAYKSKIFFSGTNRFADISSEGDYEPWMYDPISNKMSLLKELIPIKGSFPNKFIVSGNKLFFGASDENIITDLLYSSDGTRIGTFNVGDTTNKLTGMLRLFSRNTIIPLRNGVLFNAYVGISDFGLWYSDGTTTGTYKINSNGFADQFVYHPKYDKVIFTQDAQIKISDGSIAGTTALNDLIVIVAPSTASIGMGSFGDNFLIEAFDPNAGTFGLFLTNGISSTYTKLYDYGNLPSMVRNVIDLGNNHCLFSNNKGLWVTDGTKNGTLRIPKITPYRFNNVYTDFWTTYKGKMYFAAKDSTDKGVELYESDGSVAGTKLFMDINLGSGDSYPANFKVFNQILYFSANNGISGNEFWQTDGTQLGTKLIADINVGVGSSDPQYFTGLNNELYFSATDGLTGHELWKYSDAKVAVSNLKNKIDLNLFPTITSGKINLESTDLNSITSICISDLNGKVWSKLEKIKNEFNLDLPNGIYFIAFYNGNSMIHSQKIILKR
ncbi:MAG: T9SS type A sorting domain-containing protein [Saprospiraceae bacterium]